MTFQEAVQAAPAPVNEAYQPGLQALGSNSAKIQDDCRRTTGSLFLDKTLENSQPYANQPRWDYGIGVRRRNREEAFWVEVHPANTHGVTEVLRKLDWLKNFLNHVAPSLRGITRSEQPYVWIASGGIHIQKNTPQSRRLAASGLLGPLKHYSLGEP
ncbi:MAG: hypothetical protein ACOYXN_02050 [Acidobacteriota bacterium]